MSVAISIDNVIKRFGKDTIINGLSLDVRPGEFFTLLGPSGCGKTTLLRMIIGFNTIEGGEIKIDGKVINDIPTNKRNMGMVFQNYAIFPHMSVRDNVAFGLKNRKIPQAQIESQVDDLSLIHIFPGQAHHVLAFGNAFIYLAGAVAHLAVQVGNELVHIIPCLV